MGRDDAGKRRGSAGQRRPKLLSRRPAALIGLGLVSITAAGAVVGGLASAAVPTFPNNLLVFANRDFVTVEGYQDHIGETALLRVTRGGTVIGSAKGVVAEGDVAFEVNHPGGYCWGAGTGLQVTPDIKPGDKVTISFDGQDAGDTTVQDAAVDLAPTLSGTTMTVKGHLAPGVNVDQLEQRIVNPDLVGTDIARRDIRAIPGPLTPAPKGGYSSGLTVNGSTVTATYVFDTAATAQIAANGGGERLMSWQVQDADGNRQGMTIAEFGELGGPGMGGCPAGPADAVAPAPGAAAVVRSADKTQIQVNWTPAVAQPGAAAVTGYDVEAIAQGESSPGLRETFGHRASAGSTKTTISSLDAGEVYTVEVRSLAGPRMSEAFTVDAPAAPSGDITPPTITASPAPASGGALTEARQVTLTTEANADVYYTTNGSPVIVAGLPSDSAKLYTAPIPITAQTTVKFAAFDRAGNFAEGVGTYKPPALLAPTLAPALGASTADQESVTLKWNAIADDSVTGYGVQLYNNTTGATVGPIRETADRSLTITELTAGTPYSFTVKAKNGGGFGPASARSSALTPSALTDRVTIATAKWKAGDFRITGSGSSVGATVTVRIGSATGPVVGSGPVTAAAAPATGGVYDLRFRNGQAPATRPATIYVVSGQGGVAGPFTVTQG